MNQMKRQPPGGGPEKLESGFTHEELLWLRRTDEEGNHRYATHLYQVTRNYRPSINDSESNNDIEDTHFDQMYNKSVPVYFLLGLPWDLVVNIMENYRTRSREN